MAAGAMGRNERYLYEPKAKPMVPKVKARRKRSERRNPPVTEISACKPHVRYEKQTAIEYTPAYLVKKTRMKLENPPKSLTLCYLLRLFVLARSRRVNGSALDELTSDSGTGE